MKQGTSTEPSELSESINSTAITATINTALIPQRVDVESIALKDRVLIRTGSFGLNSLFLASYIASTGKFLAMLGTDGAGAAAGAITTPFQSVFLGTNVGILLATGFEIGAPIGAKDYKKAGHIAKACWALTIGLGTISSAAMFTTRPIFPLLFEQQTAEIASSFFTGYAPIAIPMLMLITSPQIAFQAGDWYIPPAASFAFLISAGSMSYLLAFPLGLGALGVGLGGSIAGLLVCIPLQLWFKKEHYNEYDLYERPISDWRKHTIAILRSGWKLSAQRLTEWGNLTLIAIVLGAGNNRSLKSSQPSIQYIGLVAITIQGLAQATGMIISRNKGAIKKAKENFLGNINEIKRLHKNNVHTLIQNNIASVLFSGTIATSFYFSREPLANFFLSQPIDTEVSTFAQTLLWINMLGLMPDAVRLVSGGALRSWDDVLYPTIVSFISMTMMGIFAGWGLSEITGIDEATLMFWIRNIAMTVASIFIVNRCRFRTTEDQLAIEQLDEDVVGQVASNKKDETSSSSSSKVDTSVASSYYGGFLKNFKKKEKHREIKSDDANSVHKVDSSFVP